MYALSLSFLSPLLISYINHHRMTPMESLLSAIDKADPIQLPLPRKRKASMSIDHIIEKRQYSPPQSPKSCHKIICYHASVAQKSYGTEKRFLCPPPIVMTTPNQSSTVVSMSIINDQNQPTLEQRAVLDDESKGYFKYLFVNSATKQKQFKLKINLQDLTFYSNPISIISKPSKKTAKITRNASSCLFNHSIISLFNRINSQTVRTKYMSSDNHQLCAKHASWSPFEIIVTRQPQQQQQPYPHHHSTAITFGTEIILKDIHTGTTSPPLILRKVEKGQIVHDATGLLSQMQKVALQLANAPHQYLNSNGKSMHPTEASGNVFIDFSSSTMNGQQQELVDDYLCWTIVGISRFEYEYQHNTFMPIQHPHSPPPSPPRTIIPFPIIKSIEYIPSTHKLKLSNLEHSLDYWLGRHGPLKKNTSTQEIELPDVQEVILNNHDLLVVKSDGKRYLELPLLLSRHDGFIYHSSKLLSYEFVLNSPESGVWSLLDAMLHKR
ncbi:hypothetical protein RMATCC62417_04873 [Rhizopus microsporus]|nr:hypothetical protein RMATCC62417_04873 [Rhizopus microsporus]